jgi:hypothetical protein
MHVSDGSTINKNNSMDASSRVCFSPLAMNSKPLPLPRKTQEITTKSNEYISRTNTTPDGIMISREKRAIRSRVSRANAKVNFEDFWQVIPGLNHMSAKPAKTKVLAEGI